MIVSTAHRAVRNAATIALADTGAGAAHIQFFTARSGTLLGQRMLQKPCAILTPEGRIALAPAPVSAADLLVASGTPGWACWCNGDGVVIAEGAVTGADGVGPFKLSGTGPDLMLYAGGVVQLLSPALLG